MLMRLSTKNFIVGNTLECYPRHHGHASLTHKLQCGQYAQSWKDRASTAMLEWTPQKVVIGHTNEAPNQLNRSVNRQHHLLSVLVSVWLKHCTVHWKQQQQQQQQQKQDLQVRCSDVNTQKKKRKRKRGDVFKETTTNCTVPSRRICAITLFEVSVISFCLSLRCSVLCAQRHSQGSKLWRPVASLRQNSRKPRYLLCIFRSVIVTRDTMSTCLSFIHFSAGITLAS